MSKQSAPGRAWLKSQTRLTRRATLPVIALSVAGTVLAIIQALCVADILGRALSVREAPAAWALATFAAAALLRAACGVLADRLAVRASAVARQALRLDIMGRLLAIGPAVLRQEHSASLASTVIDRVDALDGYFARWLPAATVAMAGPAIVLAAVAIVDWRGALILAGAGLLVPFAQAISGIGAAAASRRQFTALSRLQGRFLDRIRGIGTIVLAGRAADESAALARAADELRQRTMRVLRVAFLASAAQDCALALALVALSIRYGTGGLASVPALFVLLLVPEFFAPLRAFSTAYQDRAQAAGAADAIAAIPELPPAAETSGPVRTVNARGVSVSFEHVRFAWDPARPPALDDVSFRVPAGETVILAGPSGAGKSTVIEMLQGFIVPQAGRVLVNGADLASIVPDALTRMTATIGQRPTLFAATIRENIRFARPDADDAEVESAARSAHVTEFAAGLPQGLDTTIGEGGYGLSGGQAQRVAIARAFLKNAPLLLLDEPTSHLDPSTERDVLDSLRRLAVGRTVVLASHSAAAHRFGDRRVDLRDGRVVQARGVA